MTHHDLGDAYNNLNTTLEDRTAYDQYFVFTDMSAANEMAQRILIDREPSKNILTGIKGCGKTTELFRLLRDVEDQYIGIYSSMRAEADVRKVTATDILLSVLMNVFAGSVEKGVTINEKLVKALSMWLQDTLSPTRIEFEERRLDAAGLANKIRKARTVLKAQMVRDRVQGMLEERKGELLEHVNSLVKEVESVSKKKVLLAIDDLDKIPVSAAKEIFAEHGELLTSPGCKIVYTAPYSLVHTHEFRDVSRTFRKYVNQGPTMVIGRTAKQGIAEMKDIVSKRMALALIDDKALENAIMKTGGIMADLLRTLSEACIKARTDGQEKIDNNIVEAVLDDIRKDGARTLSTADCQKLGAINKDKSAEYDDIFLKLIDDGYIIEYAGEEGKYYVHPFVLPVLKDKKMA